MLRKVFQGTGGGRRGAARPAQTDTRFGGKYIVFVQRAGKPFAVNVSTGLTDLDYSEVVSGLSLQDSVLILPSTSLIDSQKEFNERMQRVTGGGGIPGLSTPSGTSGSTTRAPASGGRP